MTRTLKALALLVAIAVAAGSACTLDKQDAPPLSGPSELATSITLSANPEMLRQDGASQSQITILAKDSNGQPIKDRPVRLDIAVGGTLADFGQLSNKNPVTGGDGRATVLYTAPLPPADSVDNQTVVQILATPGGPPYDFAGATTRSVSIRLFPPGIILPPNGTPVPAFTYSPSAPIAKSDVTFDASLSGDSDGRIVSYAWNFGDGSQGSGVVVKHGFSNDGSYTVTLTVTDDRGQSASLSKAVSVTASANPKADFVSSPSAPVAGQQVFFNAAPSTAATGRSIVRYDWDYGSGRQDSGILVWQIYSQPGSYTVTLTVTDDAGNTGTTSKAVTVSAGGLAASFSYLPTTPTRTDTVFFNGSASTSTDGIASYSWTFGDGTSDTGVTPSHSFLAACTGVASDKIFVVSLTVRDTLGATATLAKEVRVTLCGI
jgi:PKD repeat protein